MHASPLPARSPDGPTDGPVAGRRQFIRLVGGGLVLAAAGTVAGCGSDPPEEAVRAWQTPGAESDVRRFMLAHALLAPNPHNRQPWIADLTEPDSIHLVCDGERLLPETDPFGRQILIGCGAFIELAVIAATQRGIAVTVDLFPGGAPAPEALPKGTRVASLRLGSAGSARPDPLHDQITRRHTRRSPYAAGRALPAPLTQTWASTADASGMRSGIVMDEKALPPIRRITREAFEIECVTPRTWLESARLIRIGPEAILAHRDGISLNSLKIRFAHAAGLFDPMKVPQRGSSDLQRIMESWAPWETGSGYLWMATKGNSRAAQVAAGRTYVRTHLQATAAGVDMQPLSQALQEFPEMRGPRQALHHALGIDPQRETLQMLARVGFSTEPAGPSPRRELRDLLRT